NMGCKDSLKEPEKAAVKEKTAPAIVKLTSHQQAEAKNVFNAWCSGCHGEKGRGDGPASAVLQVKPRNFLAEPFKIRSTASGQTPTRQDIFDTVTRGLPGTAMPSFAFLPEQDRWLAVDYVRKVANLDAKPDPETIDLGKESTASQDSIQRGKQVYAKMGCQQCHGPAGRGDGPSSATLVDSLGRPIPARDYTKGEYLGGDSPAAIAMRFTSGMDGTPMPSYTGVMTSAETWDLAHYILSLRQPKPAPPQDPVARGREIVNQKQCFACHIIEGKGGDVGPSLDVAAAKLQYDWVRNFLKDPPKQGKLYYYMPYRMPQLNLKPDEIESVVALFASLAKRSTHDAKREIPQFEETRLSQGKLIYFLKCTECHNMGSVIPTPEAKQQGPDLIRVSDRILYQWMPLWVNNPKQVYPQARMVDTNLTPQEVEAVQSFVWKTSLDSRK
ncbi:MAG TPA: c-type cytochrome, partial [Acidobacteriota bacterium]